MLIPIIAATVVWATIQLTNKIILGRIKMNLTIIAKKWFDDINGNTYHSVTIPEKKLYSGMAYGYDRQYEYTASELMGIDRPHNLEKEYDVNWIIVDVKRKRDL